MVLFMSVVSQMIVPQRTSNNINQVFLGQCLSGDGVGSVLLDISLD
jgi:hypothetical protein